MKRAIVLGGGIAGLSACLHLQRAGYQVTLVEQRSFVGGRAYSYHKPEAPTLDNGHHVTLGCYRHYRELLEFAGTATQLRFQSRLTLPIYGFENGRPIATTMQASRLPAPLHLLGGLLTLKGLSTIDKFAALNLGRFPIHRLPTFRRRLQRIDPNLTVETWLQQQHQTPRLIDWLWKPICLAALNTDPKIASAKLFAGVLDEAFFFKASDSAIGLFQQPLSAMHALPLQAKLQESGVELRLGQTAQKLLSEGNHLHGVELSDGNCLTADLYICALPPQRLLALLPSDVAKLWPATQEWAGFTHSSITNAYLLYDANPLPVDFASLLGTRWQWVFNASHLLESEFSGKTLLSFTISAADQTLENSPKSLAMEAHEELQRVLGVPHLPQFRKSWVIKERRATLAHTPQTERCRPDALTPIANLRLAGDWINTGLPCTLEGAAKSGFLAAQIRKQPSRKRVHADIPRRLEPSSPSA